MIAAWGHFALATALAVSLLQFVAPLWGLHRRNAKPLQLAQPAAQASFALILCAFVLLTAGFIKSDFSIAYVANHSNLSLPLMYRIAAVWGGHEGSLLLWLLMLTGWSFAVAQRGRYLPLPVSATVLSMLGGVAVGFIAFVLFTSNPFERLFPIPADGGDLNPLLQDPGLIIHPPLLYMGYVGFSVAFAFALTALIHGRLDTAWLRWTRPWTLWAWVFLTLGIMLGSWWAYNELGWGGWWFWDPVENASFMPWLVGTALIHSLAATEKRRVLAGWTVLLAICAFSLSLLGTFLVRSGVLVSVHAFATDPARGVYILLFFATVVGGSLLLYGLRAQRLVSPARVTLWSREGLLLINNVFLVVAALTVLLGTLYPLIVDAMGLPKPSIGSPWFNLTFVPIMLPLLGLVGLSYGVAWWRGNWRRSWRDSRWPLAAALLLAIILPGFAPPLRGVGVYAAILLASWTMLSALAELARWAGRRRVPPRAVWGMCLAHFGLGFFAVGVAMVSHGDTERDLAVQPGEAVEVAGYRWQFEGAREIAGPNYTEMQGRFEISQNGKPVATLTPGKRRYHSQPDNPMTEADINIGVTRDLYASMGEPLGQGAWSVRLYHKPFIRWIWLGALLMALGGALAASDRRYRAVRPAPVAATAAATA